MRLALKGWPAAKDKPLSYEDRMILDDPTEGSRTIFQSTVTQRDERSISGGLRFLHGGFFAEKSSAIWKPGEEEENHAEVASPPQKRAERAKIKTPAPCRGPPIRIVRPGARRTWVLRIVALSRISRILSSAIFRYSPTSVTSIVLPG